MTRIKVHADYYNIVCEVLDNDNNSLHPLIAWVDGGLSKREACSFPVMPPTFPSLEPPMLTFNITK